jgi:hypothetical protein
MAGEGVQPADARSARALAAAAKAVRQGIDDLD